MKFKKKTESVTAELLEGGLKVKIGEVVGKPGEDFIVRGSKSFKAEFVDKERFFQEYIPGDQEAEEFFRANNKRPPYDDDNPGFGV